MSDHAVTQAQYIAHYHALIEEKQMLMVAEWQTLSLSEMKKIDKLVKMYKKRVGFARSGKMKEYFIIK